ncbi:hypothetical protein PHMEG_0003410 [Phytophthora megakarya]|uniref:Uncharacterized protein n=1 Tax=Phytophthora megakarya TaxID=4795 RepID=A0A225WW91_9STRA|nr:hypothetical protein PHMEG_0003410 [Phytophthora megakarya]
MAGLRAKLQVKDGPLATCRNHIEHFIETLENQDLAVQLALLLPAEGKVMRKQINPDRKWRPNLRLRPRRMHEHESESDVTTSDQEDKCRHVYLVEDKTERTIRSLRCTETAQPSIS